MDNIKPVITAEGFIESLEIQIQLEKFNPGLSIHSGNVEAVLLTLKILNLAYKQYKSLGDIHTTVCMGDENIEAVVIFNTDTTSISMPLKTSYVVLTEINRNEFELKFEGLADYKTHLAEGKEDGVKLVVKKVIVFGGMSQKEQWILNKSYDAIDYAQNTFHITLDNSLASLDDLERIIAILYEHSGDQLKADIEASGEIPEPVMYTITILGCYLGRILQRNFGGDWVVESQKIPNNTLPLLNYNGMEIYPIHFIKDYLCYGKEYSVPVYYNMLSQAIWGVSSKNVNP